MNTRSQKVKAYFSSFFEGLSPVFTKQNAKPIILSSVNTAVSIGLNFLTPYVFSKVVTSFSSGENENVLGMEFTGTALAGIYGGLWTLSNVLNNVRALSLVPMAPNTAKKTAMEFMDHIMEKQSLNYHNTKPVGGQIGLVIKCYMSSNNLSSGFIGTIVPATAEMSVALGILSKYYGRDIALSLLTLIVVYSGYSVLTKKQVKKLREIMAEKGQACYDLFQKTISQYQVIKHFNNWKNSRAKLNELVEDSAKADIDGMAIIFKTGIGQSLITGLGFTAISLLTSVGIGSGKYTVADYVTIMSYLAQFSNSLYLYGQTLNQFYAALTEMKMVMDEIRIKSDINDDYPDVPLKISKNTAKIEFRNVTFAYLKDAEGNDIKILDNVSFVINPGEKVGIVATSGTGKTTIGNLLFRFFDPTSGQILINDQDIKKVSLLSLQSAIGIVPQQPTIFNDTLYNNIEFGGLSNEVKPTPEDVKNVIKLVCLDKMVDALKDKEQTLVGERGAKLSGGQQQRVVIARVLLKQSKILIFDEATSALDAAVEHDLQKNIDQISEGTSTIVFTHKFASIVNADKILVLDKGKLVEQGTHAELVSKGNLYAKLWRKQQLGINEADESKENSLSFNSEVNFHEASSVSLSTSKSTLFSRSRLLTNNNDVIIDIFSPKLK